MENNKGVIVTFYSYKGGTGRTMALANVATWLSLHGKKNVLMIDWDLEAPGLHTFFETYLDKSLNSGKGLIDLFEQISNTPKNQIAEIIHSDFNKYITHFLLEGSEMSLIKAGQLDDYYNEKIQSFDWRSFFESKYEFFPIWIEYLQKNYDYILIDSRTGLTDIAGICTMIMPERLVTVFTPNSQSVTNLLNITKGWVEYRLNSDDVRPFMIYPLPSRVDPTESALYVRWQDKNILDFENKFKDIYKIDNCNLRSYFELVTLSYIPKYAYGEKISMIEDIRQINNRLFNVGPYVELIKAIESNENLWDYAYLNTKNYKTAIERVQKAQEEGLAYLDLSELELVKIPDSVGELKQLESLDISNNIITDLVGLENLSNLKVLSISKNLIKEIQSLDNLKSLRELDASFNEISSFKGLEHLGKLNQLFINNNKISDISGVEHLKSLKQLDLSYNEIVDLNGIDLLDYLEELYVSNNQIQNLKIREIVRTIQVLDIRNNEISNLSDIGKLVNLRQLNLSNNYIEELSGIENLSALKDLNISYNSIRSFHNLKDLSRLEQLDISNNRVRQVFKIENLKALIQLNLANNEIEDIKPLITILGKKIQNRQKPVDVILRGIL
jgi:Leucine-rich repeat (LRR) protein/cellulose biosynthesis protein BcsQ